MYVIPTFHYLNTFLISIPTDLFPIISFESRRDDGSDDNPGADQPGYAPNQATVTKLKEIEAINFLHNFSFNPDASQANQRTDAIHKHSLVIASRNIQFASLPYVITTSSIKQKIVRK